MKYRLEQNKQENEVIIRYTQWNEEIERLVQFLEQKFEANRLMGRENGEKVLLEYKDILYFESVDKGTYAYTRKTVAKVEESLTFYEGALTAYGFYRCSKSMVINIYQIRKLKSESGNRILATMENGENVMISRRFAKGLREVLKGGNRHE